MCTIFAKKSVQKSLINVDSFLWKFPNFCFYHEARAWKLFNRGVEVMSFFTKQRRLTERKTTNIVKKGSVGKRELLPKIQNPNKLLGTHKKNEKKKKTHITTSNYVSKCPANLHLDFDATILMRVGNLTHELTKITEFYHSSIQNCLFPREFSVRQKFPQRKQKKKEKTGQEKEGQKPAVKETEEDEEGRNEQRPRS